MPLVNVPAAREIARYGGQQGAIEEARRLAAAGHVAEANRLIGQFGWQIDEQTGEPRESSWWEQNWRPALMMGGLMAGGIGAAALAGGGGAAVPAVTASGPMAGGLTGATTTAAVPASLAATGGGTAAAAGGGMSLGGFGWGDLINAGIQQAGNYYATRQQANASEHATDAQAKANAEALAFLKQQYADRQNQLAPYIQAGQQSLQGLSRFMGLPGTPTPATPTRPAPTYVQPGGAPGNPALANLVGYDALGRPIGEPNAMPAQPTGSTGGLPGLGNLNSLPGLGWTAGIPGSPLGRPASSVAAAPSPGQPNTPSPMPAAGGGGMVTMAGPDGSQRSVPADQVPGLEAKGARRVS
jgi:hypothetical protein